MAYTLAQLAELEAAIASGVLTVKYGGPVPRETTYQSLPAMEALRARMIRELKGTPAFRLGATRTGLDSGPGRRGFNDGGSEGGL